MTLTTILLYIALVAIGLTAVVGAFRQQKSWVMTFLQNFCGTFFIFSGWVKAVDPLGTAYKMEKYFEDFQTQVAPERMDLAWVESFFVKLHGFSLQIAVIMIVLEIVIGILLIIGSKSLLTHWTFLLIILFFTMLTGYTYLTGHVPNYDADGNEVHFFQFGNWGPWVESNMKVTDCGCFGDFLKLEPFTSFMKDIFLLIPAFLFIFKHKKMHQLFTPKIRLSMGVAATLGTLYFCVSNFMWDIPSVDFRPFHEGVNIPAAQKVQAAKETEAAAQMMYVYTNKESGEMKRFSQDEYMQVYNDYPEEKWKMDTEMPKVKASKVSDFAIQTVDGTDVTSSLLKDEDYSFMIVSYELKHKMENVTREVVDTEQKADTTYSEDGKDTIITTRIDTIGVLEETVEFPIWNEDFVEKFEGLNPLLNAAQKDGFNVYCITKFNEPAYLDNFRHAAQTAYDFYTADDIMLKTIVRSNPGIVLMKNGTIVKKWHYKQVPDYETIKADYLK